MTSNIKNYSHTNLKMFLTIITSLSVIILLFYLLYLIMQPFIFIFLGAFIITIFISPLYNFIHLKAGVNRSFSAFLALLTFVILITVPFSLITSFLVVEVNDAITYLQNNSGNINSLAVSVNHLLNQYGFYTRNLDFEINKYLTSFLSIVLTNLTSILSQTAGFIFNGFFTLIVTFYLLMNKDAIYAYILHINILKQGYSERLILRATEIINASVKGSVFIMIIQFVLSLLGFVVFGVKSPVLVASLYGIFSLIPGIGIGLIWIPVCLLLFLSGNYFSAVGVLSWCLTTNFIMDNVISPRIIAKSTKLHPMLIVFGILGGISMFGFFGIVLGPTIIALSFVALDMLSEIYNGGEEK